MSNGNELERDDEEEDDGGMEDPSITNNPFLKDIVSARSQAQPAQSFLKGENPDIWAKVGNALLMGLREGVQHWAMGPENYRRLMLQRGLYNMQRQDDLAKAEASEARRRREKGEEFEADVALTKYRTGLETQKAKELKRFEWKEKPVEKEKPETLSSDEAYVRISLIPESERTPEQAAFLKTYLEGKEKPEKIPSAGEQIAGEELRALRTVFQPTEQEIKAEMTRRGYKGYDVNAYRKVASELRDQKRAEYYKGKQPVERLSDEEKLQYRLALDILDDKFNEVYTEEEQKEAKEWLKANKLSFDTSVPKKGLGRIEQEGAKVTEEDILSEKERALGELSDEEILKGAGLK